EMSVRSLRAASGPRAQRRWRPSLRHLDDTQRIEPEQILARQRRIEAPVGRPDAEKEAVARREIEFGRVEQWVMELGEPVQQQHAEERRERSTEDRQLECRWNEDRPAVERTPARVDRIVDDRAVPLQEIDAAAADQAAEQRDQ